MLTVITALLGLLNDPTFQIRFDATMQLIRIGDTDEEICRVLTEAMDDESPITRVQAAKPLFRIDPTKAERVTPILIDALHNPIFPLRVEAAETLRKIETAEAMEAVSNFNPFQPPESQ